ncbi:bestrophin-2-like isoform X1 [Daphnia pulex]|uniref:bestrophin-2-like isoform X1 n=3 Tax=Daphnia pulex TaxID=6669 RepID=UPI001EDF4895|nr:bestrophin-2-like isoform X1 [Daphnia pulex]
MLSGTGRDVQIIVYESRLSRIVRVIVLTYENSVTNSTMLKSVGNLERTVSQVPSVIAFNQTAPEANSIGESIRVLLRWRGSIYKKIWKQLLVYYLLYYMLTILHNFVLDEDGKTAFVALAKYCNKNSNSINLMIMLTFFTTTAMQRLFALQTMIPGTAKVITYFILSLKQNLPEGPVIVEQFARWAVLAWILTFRVVCKPLRKMFPDMISLQMAGIIKEKERIILERVETERNKTPRALMVIDWMFLLLKECSIQNRFMENSNFLKCADAVMVFKKNCGNTIKIATKNIPCALIQAVIIVVYTYGLVTLMARNVEEASSCEFLEVVVNYFPVIPSMQFFIFLIWLNFGRVAVNPFGADEDDIDVKLLLENHIQDSIRLTHLYTQDLEHVFGAMPGKQYHELSSVQTNALPI